MKASTYVTSIYFTFSGRSKPQQRGDIFKFICKGPPQSWDRANREVKLKKPRTTLQNNLSLLLTSLAKVLQLLMSTSCFQTLALFLALQLILPLAICSIFQRQAATNRVLHLGRWRSKVFCWLLSAFAIFTSRFYLTVSRSNDCGGPLIVSKNLHNFHI